MTVIDLEREDWRRAAELVLRYAGLPLGAVDASVVAVAERLGLTEIATIDRRHFGVVRPRYVNAFTLLPGLTSTLTTTRAHNCCEPP